MGKSLPSRQKKSWRESANQKGKGGRKMRMCDACGKQIKSGTGVGRAILCRTCLPDVMAEIERLRQEGKPTDAITIARQIFRETHSAGAYLLRDIPEKLWTAAKHKAVDEKLSLRELILKALQEYLTP
jgi:hypothetical protein